MAKVKRKAARKAPAAASTSAQVTPKKRGKAARLAELAATLDAATALAAGTHAANGHAPKKQVAVPRKGAGRRKMVDATSLDGIAAQLANELAADIVDKVRVIADRMVRTTLADMLSKL